VYQQQQKTTRKHNFNIQAQSVWPNTHSWWKWRK